MQRYNTSNKGQGNGVLPETTAKHGGNHEGRTLNVNKIELGILGMALFELYQIEQCEEHPRGWWEILDELHYKILVAKEAVQ